MIKEAMIRDINLRVNEKTSGLVRKALDASKKLMPSATSVQNALIDKGIPLSIAGGIGLTAAELAKTPNDMSAWDGIGAVIKKPKPVMPMESSIQDYPWENTAPVGRPPLRPNFVNSTNIIRPATKPIG